MSLVGGQLFRFKAFVASQRLVHSFLCCSRKTFSECLSTECVNQYKASTSSPPPWVTPLVFELLKIGLFKFPYSSSKKKKRHFIPLEGLYNSGSNSLPHLGNIQIPHPWECLFFQMSTSWAQTIVNCPREAGGGGERYVEALNWLAQQNQEKNKILTSNQYQWFLPLCGKLIKVLK